jgi:adenylate kinase
LLKYKIDNNGPKRAARILVLGPPGSGRSTLSKQLCKKYGFFYISTRELIADLINQRGEAGRLAVELMNQGELIPDEIVNSLVRERIAMPDC